MKCKYFISHTQSDEGFAKILLDILPAKDKKRQIYFSSDPEKGADAKESLIAGLDKKLNKCKTIILLITENYLRSYYCAYEMSVAGYLKRTKNKPVIAIMNNDKLQKKIEQLLPDTTFIFATDPNKAATSLIKALNISDTSKLTRAEEFFAEMGKPSSPFPKPYIGMTDKEFDESYSFIEKYGVERMTFGNAANKDTMDENLKDAAEMILISTTGAGLLKTFQPNFLKAVKAGATLTVAISDLDSLFSVELSELEKRCGKTASDDDSDFNDNRDRLKGEFRDSIFFLKEIANGAKASDANGERVVLCSAFTLLRQTAFVVKYKDGSVWGWISCTMPPARCAEESTPSFVVKGKIENEENPFAASLWNYASSIVKFARSKGAYRNIHGKSPVECFNNPYPLYRESFDEARAYWKEKQALAMENMSVKQKASSGAILIEVAAQHPLKNGREPAVEFCARLDKATELYNELKKEGCTVKIYVPGSVHIPDTVSLSAAGCEYLRVRGIPVCDIIGEDANIKYKGNDGVYNSADECFVASRIFEDGEYGRLISICSQNQIMRKTMLYLEFGIVAEIYGVRCDNMFHQDAVKEIFGSLNSVLYFDHTWQDENSEAFIATRRDRKPKS